MKIEISLLIKNNIKGFILFAAILLSALGLIASLLSDNNIVNNKVVACSCAAGSVAGTACGGGCGAGYHCEIYCFNNSTANPPGSVPVNGCSKCQPNQSPNTGSTPGSGTGGCTTGDCFIGIANCGAVGRPNGTGSCNGGLCCNPPSSPPATVCYDAAQGWGPSNPGQIAVNQRWIGFYGYACAICQTNGQFASLGIYNSANCENVPAPNNSCNNATAVGTISWRSPGGAYWYDVMINDLSNPSLTCPARAGGTVPTAGTYVQGPDGDLCFTLGTSDINFSIGGRSVSFVSNNSNPHDPRKIINYTITPGRTYSWTVNTYDYRNPPGGYYIVQSVNSTLSCCTATNPSAVTQISPANGSTIPTPTSVTLSWNNTAWGTGCPSNNNLYQVYTGLSSSGPWTLQWQGAANSANITGLAENTTYYWYVRKTNGTNAVTSAVWSFKTNSSPQLYYGGQAAADVCGTGFIGRAGPSNVTNPIRLSFGMIDLNSDTPTALNVAFVPRSVSGGAATYPNANVQANVGSWSSIFIAMGYGAGNTYWVSQYHPSTGTTSAGVGTSEFVVGNGVAKVLNIGNSGSGTYGLQNETNVNTWFQIKLENNFGISVSNPTGIWDVYSIYTTTGTDGVQQPSFGTWDWIRMGELKIDLQSPSASISGPTYNSDGSFTMVYSGFDNMGILRVPNYITTLEASPSLRDNTISENITFGSPPSTTTWPPNGFYYDYSGVARPTSFNVTRNYTDNSVADGVQYNYIYQVIDQACNPSGVTTSATEPTPWIMVSGGNASVNGNTMVNSISKNISIPDVISSNVAIGKTATQSSTLSGAAATRAIDGNINGDWAANSVTHTDSNAQAWWQLDLGSVYSIGDIKIYNRTDSATTRLSNFYLFVSDNPFSSTDLTTTINQSGVSNYYTSGAADSVTIKNVNRSGRYVRVQLSGTNYLSLAEVQVFASQSFSLTGLSGYTYDGGSSGPFFTTYSTMSGSSQRIAQPTSNISKLNRYISDYINDAATPQIGTSWYDYLKNIVQSNGASTQINFATTNEVTVGNAQFPVGQQYSGNLSTIFGVPVGSKRIINATGNIWLAANSVCDIQAIIFIDGNFRIAPNFTKSGANDACIFVVKGNISIGIGTTGASVALSSSSQPYYDQIAASFVADGFVWADNNAIGATFKGEGLYIRGSVIAGGNFEWNRDLNTYANAFHPAVIIYNDPIYYNTFRNDFRIKDYSIKERQ